MLLKWQCERARSTFHLPPPLQSVSSPQPALTAPVQSLANTTDAKLAAQLKELILKVDELQTAV